LHIGRAVSSLPSSSIYWFVVRCPEEVGRSLDESSSAFSKGMSRKPPQQPPDPKCCCRLAIHRRCVSFSLFCHTTKLCVSPQLPAVPRSAGRSVYQTINSIPPILTPLLAKIIQHLHKMWKLAPTRHNTVHILHKNMLTRNKGTPTISCSWPPKVLMLWLVRL
jgi:hypothetical protein